MNGLNEMTVIGENDATVEALSGMQRSLDQAAVNMNAMADMLRANQMMMDKLTQEVHALTKVTPAQARALNERIRDHAAELCRANRCEGCEKAMAAAIRKHVKLSMGIGNARELPRSDWGIAMSAVDGWNDYRTIKKIREGKK